MNSVTQILWEDIKEEPGYELLIEKVLQKCFEVEKINPTSLYVCITLTNAENIKKLNKQYRNIDKTTDVLSFPIFEKSELDDFIAKNALRDINTENGILQDIMGDIVISIPKVKEQAEEYGHSFEREFSYMLVHGFYHLRGYDHMTEDEKQEMRAKEEYVLEKLNVTR